ncbi:MAG: hypothetical protein RL748_1874 [Pseudomonadota bacterium]|jgi:hypothetical protein
MVKKPDPGKRQKEVRLYVEGGGDAATLKSSCREGFATFLEKAGLKGHMPRIIACGGREDAFDSFCTTIANGVNAFYLLLPGRQWLCPQAGRTRSLAKESTGGAGCGRKPGSIESGVLLLGAALFTHAHSSIKW